MLGNPAESMPPTITQADPFANLDCGDLVYVIDSQGFTFDDFISIDEDSGVVTAYTED